MLGDNKLAIEKLNDTEKANEELENKNRELINEINNTSEKMNKAAKDLEESVGKVESFESENSEILTKYF